MKQNNWENTRTQQYYGPNTILGSPRGWLQRAVGQKSDLFLHPTSLQPNEIAVAGVWRRGQPIPDMGNFKTIYRYFRIAEPIRRISVAKPQDFYPVIGMGVAVPADQVFQVYNLFRQTAEWVWMDWPKSVGNTDQVATEPRKKQQGLDHHDLYRRFEKGQRPVDIAQELDLLAQSVQYVYKKWQAGAAPNNRKMKKSVDHSEVIQDLRIGTRVCDIIKKYNISKTMIYKIKGKYSV